MRGEQYRDIEVHNRSVRAYSARHQQWLTSQGGQHTGGNTVVTETHTGDTGQPPDDNIGVYSTPTENIEHTSYTVNRQT